MFRLIQSNINVENSLILGSEEEGSLSHFVDLDDGNSFISESVFIGLWSWKDGAVLHNSNSFQYENKMTILNSSFVNQTSISGGSIFASNAFLKIENSEFILNHAE